mmetsp:Transcript_70671/g.210740  ORF Transcript_70671/g.210740 Transcript_70671/m.210740 type:complete len:200 (-) Transcript_70671:107-706(-)
MRRHRALGQCRRKHLRPNSRLRNWGRWHGRLTCLPSVCEQGGAKPVVLWLGLFRWPLSQMQNPCVLSAFTHSTSYLVGGCGSAGVRIVGHRHAEVGMPQVALRCMPFLQGLLFTLSNLMKSPASTPEMQRLAGSVITLTTDLPVTSQISDDKTGSYGRVNIVLPRPSRVYRPDSTMLELAAGVPPSGLGNRLRSPSLAV